MTRGWSRRQRSNHEIPVSYAARPARLLLAAWRPLSGPYTSRKTATRLLSRAGYPSHTPEARLAAIDRHRIEWWQKATQSMRYWQKAFLPGDATYLLGLIRDHKVRKRCFWHA